MLILSKRTPEAGVSGYISIKCLVFLQPIFIQSACSFARNASSPENPISLAPYMLQSFQLANEYSKRSARKFSQASFMQYLKEATGSEKEIKVP
jgi:hypothetical protein